MIPLFYFYAFGGGYIAQKIIPKYRVDELNKMAKFNNFKYSQLKEDEDYINELKISHPSFIILDEYINAYTEIRYKCTKCNYVWLDKPKNVRKRKYCPNCHDYSSNSLKKTTEIYKSELNIINPFIEVVGEYEGSNKRIDVLCKICKYRWSPFASALLSGHGCPHCSRNLSFKEFEAKLSDIFPHFEIISYAKADEKVTVRCKICGYIFSRRGNDLLRGHKIGGNGCRNCFKNNKMLSPSEYSDRFYKINDTLHLLSEYVDSRTNVSCECLICGNVWSTKPFNLLGSNGCPVCAKNRTAEKLRISECDYRERLNFANSNIILVNGYNGISEKSLHKCLVCGYEWNVIPNSLLIGYGCPKCAGNAKKTHTEFVCELKKINPFIKIVSTYLSASSKVLCECEKCGNNWSATANSLLSGTGCPICRISLGEKIAYAFLKENQIDFIYQMKYDNLLGIGGGKLSYDFYLPKFNILIEIQGEQHRRPIEYFGGEEKFIIQQEHDRRKREYAKQHNIELLEIWPEDFSNIEYILNNKLNLKLESVETVIPI